MLLHPIYDFITTTEADMADLQERIAQWEKMAQEAPDGMAYLSLGNAYKDAGRPEDAADALRKAIELDEKLSRAYQVLGSVLIDLRLRDEAIEILNKGYVIAAELGDVMPKKAIGSLLEAKLQQPLPEVDESAEAQPELTDENMIIDKRSRQPQPKLPDPPMRGPIGQFIFENYGVVTWREWIAQGTKVINELRLDFSNEAHQKLYEDQMLEWLGITREEIEETMSS